MEKFKAFRIEEVDKQIRSGFVDMTLDQLDPGEVVVRVAYSDVNYKDALAATGAGKILRRPACVGGIDFSGTVVSSADPAFKAGDQVLATGYDLGVAHHGGYAEYARVPAAWLVPLPPGLTLFDAMALGTAGFTAALGIVRMEHEGLKPENGPVIVTGATGGVGSIAIDVLSRLGYRVVALTGKESETEYLKGIGAAEVILRSSLDLSKIRPLDKATWAGAVDNLGGEVLAWIASTMKIGGTIASIGLALGSQLNTTVMPFILRGVSLLGVDSVNCPIEVRRRVWARLGTDMRPAHLNDMVHMVPFEKLPSVFDDFIQGKAKGRTVVEIAGS
ncbi:oxidoreductase [Pelomicrobium methylotrophicum]|uniref:Oxidoreductase n=1 Tax=Pelomicrobium methylotrophicum TaxID=2602750 RepID=A0A5C7EIP7_9PROT|nr:oxidoreductase [Pelomicrobium methylotrophicum]TXF10774.1 oxidoreductase [Pelomicrobium methylotrophicum]